MRSNEEDSPGLCADGAASIHCLCPAGPSRWPSGKTPVFRAGDTGFDPPLSTLRHPPRERKVPGSNPACDGIFSGSSHTSDLNTGTPVATLPGAWRYRVSTGTGRPGVSIL